VRPSTKSMTHITNLVYLIPILKTLFHMFHPESNHMLALLSASKYHMY
jgi:hypothetical protein